MTTLGSLPKKIKNPEGFVTLPGSVFTALAFVNSGRVKITEELAKILKKMKEGRIKNEKE
ncbi:MAG: hypothetical protein UR56_C0002G0089 [Candidatus Roizmanbacteria bacterium GW2011_GWC2_34_23]|uniref:Uncharacterized protein n=1 Tax=Candidatus Roizmanbacteria bacterium GW2011_GWC2_34_23 TaxID=1618484 RepID=A0A0G0E708_9BACT|nr:MAG: hypothetical protein UR56_C0002G0089 [Candidatus Roizmanbacteria bacterium GW2011_GWC2_34_23]